MKLKSLILGSIAAVGLSTAGFAADLGVLTSLDVCDELGLSGLTISSDTNCLQISGEVKYEFNFGNFNRDIEIARVGNGVVRTVGDVTISAPSELVGVSNNDWESRVQSYLKFVGTAGSDFGPASAVIKIKHDDRVRATNAILNGNDPSGQREGGKFITLDEAYVQVGDTTVLTAGKRGSIFNKGDDEPFNFTGLFISSRADSGVLTDENNIHRHAPKFGGHVIQLWSNVGEGLIAKIGFENLNSDGGFDVLGRNDNVTGAQKAGTLVGVLDYSGAGITAHLSAAAGGLLDGERNNGDTYLVHTGVTATFDQFKVRAAGAFGGGFNEFHNSNYSYWNGLISGEAKFDMFKVALSAEALGGTDLAGASAPTDYGFGGSFGAAVADGIEINIGGRYFNDGREGVGAGYQVAAQLIAALTETIKLTGEIGVYGHGADDVAAPDRRRNGETFSDFYGKAELAWAPGGGFTSSVGATAQQNGAYKVTFKAVKAFQ